MEITSKSYLLPYFAPSSQKSYGYTNSGYWAYGRSLTGVESTFMGLYATAYGNPLKVKTSANYTEKRIQPYNCVHAYAGAQLRNDEIIFYNEDATVIKYLVEFNK